LKRDSIIKREVEGMRDITGKLESKIRFELRVVERLIEHYQAKREDLDEINKREQTKWSWGELMYHEATLRGFEDQKNIYLELLKIIEE